MINIIAKSTVDKNNIQEFLDLSEKLVIETRKEKGCISYNLCKDNNDNEVFFFIECWEDSDSFEAHLNTLHFKNIFPLLKRLRKDDLDAIINTVVF